MPKGTALHAYPCEIFPDMLIIHKIGQPARKIPMQFFVMFIFGAVILGAGAMLAPALPTGQPRIGTAAALALALVTGGAVFWTQLFGYDPLLMDYLLFALVSGVVLGGTLSSAQARAEAKGEELPDADQGWTGPQDLVFFALVGLLLALLSSFSTAIQAQTAPPIYQLLLNYLIAQLEQAPSLIETSVGAVLAFLSVWAIYDVGSEWAGKRIGRTMAIISLALIIILLLNAQFIWLMGLLYSAAALLFLLRTGGQLGRLELVVGGLLVGATLEVNGFLMLGVVLFSILISLLNPAGNRQHLKNISLMLVIMVIATAPWWLTQGTALWILPENPIWLLLTSAILPISLIGGSGLLALWEKLIPEAVQAVLYQRFYAISAIGMMAIIGTWWLLTR
jgi:hypothetical protein